MQPQHFQYTQASKYILRNGIQFHTLHWPHSLLFCRRQHSYHRDTPRSYHNHYLSNIVVLLQLIYILHYFQILVQLGKHMQRYAWVSCQLPHTFDYRDMDC